MGMKKRTGLQNAVIILAFLLIFGFRFLPIQTDLSTSAIQLLGIFAGVLLLWLFVSIDWPSVLLLGALALIPELKFSSILASAYGGSTFVFLLFTFIVTYALQKTSFLKRLAVAFITSNSAKRGPWHFVILYFLSILFIGCFISPTVLFFVYYPILEEIAAQLKIRKGDSLGALLMMGTVIMCGISSGMTLIAHAFPVIAVNLFAQAKGVSISPLTYSLYAIPSGLLTAALTVVMFRVFLRPDMHQLTDFRFTAEAKTPYTVREKKIIAIFFLVVFLWVFPGAVKNALAGTAFGSLMTKLDAYGTAMPPLIGIVILSVLTDKGEPLCSLNDAMKNGVSWPSLIMCAGTLALGSALTNADIGLTAWLSGHLSPLFASLGPIMTLLLFTFWAALQTNLSSNMVTATLVASAVLSLSENLDLRFVQLLIINVGMMASYSFATPPAMPCVAIAGGSGYTNPAQMMVYGFGAMLIGVICSCLVGYPLMFI